MDEGKAQNQSILFTVRIWRNQAGQTPLLWRGKVQAVPNGAWRYFHDWETLATFLQAQVEELVGEP
jgi:hypothetical protein